MGTYCRDSATRETGCSERGERWALGGGREIKRRRNLLRRLCRFAQRPAPTAQPYPNHSRGQSRCCRAASMTHCCVCGSTISETTRLNQALASFVSPTRLHSSPTRYVSTARSSRATPSKLPSASSNFQPAFRRKNRSASMSPSSTQHHAARSSRSATCSASIPCHSATFAAASYFSEPVSVPHVTHGASSFHTRSFSPVETSVSSVKSRSEPE